MAKSPADRLRRSNRLLRLLAVLRMRFQAIESFLGAFPEETSDYLEFSVHEHECELGLMTRGGGEDYSRKVARYMQKCGIGVSSLGLFEATASLFEHRRLFVKVEFGPGGVQECSWYFRRRPRLEVALSWLERAGVGPDGIRLAQTVAQVLGKPTVHFLAAAEQPGGASQFKLYFSQPERVESWLRLQAAAEVCGIAADNWAPLEAYRSVLAGRTCFLSVGFAGGGAAPGVKVDIHGLEPAIVQQFLQAAGQGPAAAIRLTLLLALVGKERLDYAGFRLHPGHPPVTKMYAYRSGRSRSRSA